MTTFLWLSIALFVILMAVFLWMRWCMKVSKARFAFITVSSMVTCLVSAISVSSAGLPALIVSKTSFFLGLGEASVNLEGPAAIAVPIVAISTIYFIYRFSRSALINWEAPARVSELELAESYLQNNLAALALEQFKLFVKRQNDPIASEYASNWEKNLSEPPKPVEVKDLLRDLLTMCIRETTILDSGWRDESRLWVGETYGKVDSSVGTILALVFDRTPTENEILQRASSVISDLGADKIVKLYGLYVSEDQIDDASGIRKISGVSLEILSSRVMIYRGLDLKSYARELLRSFRTTKIGGTNATLNSSFVELRAKRPFTDQPPFELSMSLKSWATDNANRHLAITGEYGQGKSTALLKYCCDWAERFLQDEKISERVPLLIELRGKSPSENDPLEFVSSWCSRYQLLPKQVLNLIKSGDAIVIFEGFDELKNSGRAFDRHQHFNALWRFAYPGTKIIFTGRPNFFLDEVEANRTLRHDKNRGASGAAFTEVWRLQKLDRDQIVEACRSYEPNVRSGLSSSIFENEVFFDIVARPSMLPVVATIWSDIEELQQAGIPLTGAILIEKYIQAIFERKEAELEKDRIVFDAPSGSRYLVLPKPVRELLTICVAWRMSGLRGKNTIARSEVNAMVRDVFDTLFAAAKAENVSPVVVDGLLEFEKRHLESNLADKIDAISTEVCSAGLLVPDPAGGSTNLRFPHKQFLEFLLAKGICILGSSRAGICASIITKSSSQKSVLSRLEAEPNSIEYLAECNGPSIAVIFDRWGRLAVRIDIYTDLLMYPLINSVRKILEFGRSNESTRSGNLESELSLETFEKIDLRTRAISRLNFIASMLAVFGFLTLSGGALINDLGLPSENRSLYFAPVFGVLMAIGMSATSSLYFSTSRLDILIKFLSAHWRRADQRPMNTRHRLSLAGKTLLRGKVEFPEEKVEYETDFEQFLYPSKDFGR